MYEQNTDSSASLFRLCLAFCVPWFALGRLSSDGTQESERERKKEGEMWVVKVGHMLRENENERGGDGGR